HQDEHRLPTPDDEVVVVPVFGGQAGEERARVGRGRAGEPFDVLRAPGAPHVLHTRSEGKGVGDTVFTAKVGHARLARSLRSLLYGLRPLARFAFARSLRSLWYVRCAHFGTGTTCPFVRSLRSLLF